MQKFDPVKIGLCKDALDGIRKMTSIYCRRALMTDRPNTEREMKECAEWLKAVLPEYIDAEVNKLISTLGLEKN